MKFKVNFKRKIISLTTVSNEATYLCLKIFILRQNKEWTALKIENLFIKILQFQKTPLSLFYKLYFKLNLLTKNLDEI